MSTEPGPRERDAPPPDAAESDAAEPEPGSELGAEPAVTNPEATGTDDADPGPDATDAEPDTEPDVTEPSGDAGGPAGPPASDARRTRLIRIATIALCGALGVALAAQLRQTGDDGALPTARETDLVRILDELDAREERLRGEIRDLENRRRAISSSAQGSESALAEARRRATELGVLAGTVPARGPGLVLRFDGEDQPVPADVLLDTVQELRGAGAEAMQISGRDGPAVRIVASTYFVDSGRGIEVDGRRLDEPYLVTVIGDPTTMLAALNIPGGVVDTVGQTGGTVQVDQPDRVTVTALRRPRPPRHAQPVP